MEFPPALFDQFPKRLLLNLGVLDEIDGVSLLGFPSSGDPKIDGAAEGCSFESSVIAVSTVRVPAVYLSSAEGSILAFLPFIEINNLYVFKENPTLTARNL